MGREGTRGASSRKKSPKKAQQDEVATDATSNSNNSTNKNDAATTPNPHEAAAAAAATVPQHHPLARVVDGLNRRSLLTGMYGARGERIRHVVANGALALPKDSLDLMAQWEDVEAATGNELLYSSNNNNKSSKNNKKRKAQQQQLPGLDSVVRPSVDKALHKIAVTDIFHKAFVNPTDPTLPPVMRTVAMNRTVDLLIGVKPSNSSTGGIIANVSNPMADERIRGGGGEEEEDATPAATATPEIPSAPATTTAPTAAATTTTTAPAAATTTTEATNAATTTTEATNAAPPSQSVAPAEQTQTDITDAAATQQPAATDPATTSASQPVVPVSAPAPVAAPVPAASEAASAPATKPEAAQPVAAAGAGATPATAIPTATTPAADSTVTPTPASLTQQQTATTPAVPTSAPAPAPAATAPVAAAATTPATSAAAAPTTASTPAPAPTPTARRASVLAPLEAATEKVIPLDKKPSPHWEQHIPSANDENMTDPEAKTPKPDWFTPAKASNLERTLLPEWFDESASHRTEDTYLKARATMIHISGNLGNRFVTSTLARRSLPGDVGSLHRLHTFLTHYLWMNEEGRNDSAPTASSLQGPPQLAKRSVWTEKRRGDLIHAVVEVSQQQQAASKKPRTQEGGGDDPMEVDDTVEQDDASDDSSFVDWDAIGEKVGASAGECEREFLAMPLDGTAAVGGTSKMDRPITPDTMASEPPTTATSSSNKPKDLAQEEFLRSLVDESSPDVIKAVTEAALRVSGQDLPGAQRAARLGLVASQAVKAAQAHEETVSRLLSEVVDQRMQKLECRMALMDDLEGMLEAERVALELERRDLYTTRCRDWFGGG